MNYKPY